MICYEIGSEHVVRKEWRTEEKRREEKRRNNKTRWGTRAYRKMRTIKGR